MVCEQRQRGFTLMELMVVVAILAILAVIAIPVFSKWKKRAIRAEVASVLGEISLKQEAYRSEFSAYMNCPDAQQWWPNLQTGGEPVKKVVGANACWSSMGLRTDPNLYCAYSIYGGAANNWGTVLAADKAAFPGGAVPTTTWYLGIAECDFDGTPNGRGNNSVFYRTHQAAALGERNPEK